MVVFTSLLGFVRGLDSWNLKVKRGQVFGFLGVVLFVVGVLLVPAIHKMHCGSSDLADSHNPDTCEICAVSGTALVVDCEQVAVAFERQQAGTDAPSSIHIPSVSIPQSRSVRGPPVPA